MNIFHGPLKIFSHLSLAWPSDAMISKQSADSQKINAAKYYKRGETIEQYVEVRLRRKKWRHPITLTHTHNVHSAWILLIALLRKLRSILISQLSAETKTLSKKIKQWVVLPPLLRRQLNSIFKQILGKYVVGRFFKNMEKINFFLM